LNITLLKKLRVNKNNNFGTDANALVAKALKLEVPSRFKIVAFVDKNNQNSSKRMLDLPILTQRKKITHLDAIWG
jgi:FlaA1/EpsC-like NDP-sugar epimerase